LSGKIARACGEKLWKIKDIWDNLQDRSRLVKTLNEKGEVHNLETSFRSKNGNVKICLMSSQPLELNGEKSILTVTRDGEFR
jgi:hypothetical protein